MYADTDNTLKITKSKRTNIQRDQIVGQQNNPPPFQHDIIKETSFNENFHQYLLNSTLHGLRYVGETNISIFERTFFLLSFLLVVALSFYFISNVYEKWNASPIIITNNAVATSITDIPFPAVTICNMNQARKSMVKDIQAGTMEDALLSSLCLDSNIRLSNGNNDNDTSVVSVSSNYSGKWPQFRAFLLNVSQPCSQMLVNCRFASHTGPCMELFNTVLTDDGLCCTFNGVHPGFLLQKYDSTDEFDSVNETGGLEPNDWTPETGFDPTTKGKTYPRPAAGPGSHMGLKVILNAMLDEYFCSSTSSFGFKVTAVKILLHNPTETPKITDFGLSTSPGHEARVVITPRISDASRLIRSVSKDQRKCIFSNEGNLTYFRTYSRKNCEMECESRKIEESCGCVLYYMPRTRDDSNICGRRDMKCVRRIMLLVELNTNISYQCTCLPGCFEINYYTDVYTATLGSTGFAVRERVLDNIEPDVIRKDIAVIMFYYEDGAFRSFTKEQLIGFTEFLSNTGGLLGLFMGFSVVSFVEIIYFMSLRPYCARKRYNNHLDKSSMVNGKHLIVEPVRRSNYTNVYPMNDLNDFYAKPLENQKFGKYTRESMFTTIKDRVSQFGTKISSTIKDKFSGFGNYIRSKQSTTTQEYEPTYPYTE